MFLNDQGTQGTSGTPRVFVPVRGIMFLNESELEYDMLWEVFVPVRGIMFLNKETKSEPKAKPVFSSP